MARRNPPGADWINPGSYRPMPRRAGTGGAPMSRGPEANAIMELAKNIQEQHPELVEEVRRNMDPNTGTLQGHLREMPERRMTREEFDAFPRTEVADPDRDARAKARFESRPFPFPTIDGLPATPSSGAKLRTPPGAPTGSSPHGDRMVSIPRGDEGPGGENTTGWRRDPRTGELTMGPIGGPGMRGPGGLGPGQNNPWLNDGKYDRAYADQWLTDNPDMLDMLIGGDPNADPNLMGGSLQSSFGPEKAREYLLDNPETMARMYRRNVLGRLSQPPGGPGKRGPGGMGPKPPMGTPGGDPWPTIEDDRGTPDRGLQYIKYAMDQEGWNPEWNRYIPILRDFLRGDVTDVTNPDPSRITVPGGPSHITPEHWAQISEFAKGLKDMQSDDWGYNDPGVTIYPNRREYGQGG